MLSRPDLFELLAGKRHLRHLLRPDASAAPVVRGWLLDQADSRPREAPALEHALHSSSTSTSSPAAATPSPGAISASAFAPSIEVSTCDPCAPLVGETR